MAAVVVSVGPGTIRELVSGVTFVRPPAASIPAPILHTEPALQAGVDGVSAAFSHGRLALAIVDLQSGATASVDAERALPAASLFKLPILLEVLTEQEAGRLDPDLCLAIRAEDWTDGSGVLQGRVGDQLAVRELTRLMIQQSDNIAALVLMDAVGLESVNGMAERLGMRATRSDDVVLDDVAIPSPYAVDVRTPEEWRAAPPTPHSAVGDVRPTRRRTMPPM